MIYDKIAELIPGQYTEAENFNKILKIFGAEVDELLVAIEQVKTAFLINSAVADQLDILGAIVVIPRNGLIDEEYREAIKFKIFQNTSKARVEDLILILKTITQATKIVYSDHPPAGYTIYTDGSKIDGDLNDIMKRLSGVGIEVVVEMGLGQPPLVFPNTEPLLANLIDELGNNIVTETGLQIVVNISDANLTQDLLELYQGDGFGTVATNNLTDELGNNIVTEEGKQIVVTDLDGESDDKGGYLPITF
jgi:hypothetical protein